MLVSASDRLTGFILSVSNSSTEEADCGEVYTDTVPAGGQVTIQCGHVGRYVHFRRVQGFEPNAVTLCEVEVFGQKIMGRNFVNIVLVMLICVTIMQERLKSQEPKNITSRYNVFSTTVCDKNDVNPERKYVLLVCVTKTIKTELLFI